MINFLKYAGIRIKIEFLALSILGLISFAFEIASISLLIPIINILDNSEIPILFKKFFDFFNLSLKNFQINEIFIYSLISFIFFFIIRSYLFYYLQIRQVYFNAKVTVFLKKKIFDIIFQDFKFVSNKNKFSNLNTIIIDDIQNFSSYVAGWITILRDVTLSIFLSIFLIIMDINVFIFSILIFSFLGFLYLKLTNKKFYNLSLERRKYFEARSNLLYKIFFGFAELKLSKKIRPFFNLYLSEEKKLLNISVKKTILVTLPQVIFQVFLVLSVSAVLFLVHLFQKENIFSFITVFTLIALRLFPMISSFLKEFQVLKTYTKSVQTINKWANEKILKSENTKIINNWNNLEFSISNFGFNKKRTLFNKIYLKLDRGKKYLLYGNNGTGKSTLAKLLVGIEKSKNSKFYLNGIKINSSFESKINLAYLPQKPFLLEGSIYENITFKKIHSNFNSDKHYKKVIKVCLVDQILKQNNIDHKTNIGENGKFISGGEAKKIMLARILYNKPSFLILDELLDSIDKKSQLKLIKNLFNFDKKITVLMITHRKIFNNLFDSIIRLNN